MGSWLGQGLLCSSGALTAAAAVMFSCFTAAAPGRDIDTPVHAKARFELTQRQKEMLICAALLGKMAQSFGTGTKAGEYYNRAKGDLLDALIAAKGENGFSPWPDGVALRQGLEIRASRYLKSAPALFDIDALLCESRYAR